jgi:hypothetical protein
VSSLRNNGDRQEFALGCAILAFGALGFAFLLALVVMLWRVALA